MLRTGLLSYTKLTLDEVLQVGICNTRNWKEREATKINLLNTKPPIVC